MTREEWKNEITESCRRVGTYRKEFDPVIDTLAGILEKRDKTEDQFQRSGGNAVVTHTNKAGAANLAKNPLLIVIGELNTQALAYWRDLGLTPSGLRRLNEEALKQRKTSALAEVLKELGG